MMVTIDAERDGVFVVYKIQSDNTRVEDIRVFQHHHDAKAFVNSKKEEGWMIWQRPIE